MPTASCVWKGLLAFWQTFDIKGMHWFRSMDLRLVLDQIKMARQRGKNTHRESKSPK